MELDDVLKNNQITINGAVKLLEVAKKLAIDKSLTYSNTGTVIYTPKKDYTNSSLNLDNGGDFIADITPKVHSIYGIDEAINSKDLTKLGITFNQGMGSGISNYNFKNIKEVTPVLRYLVHLINRNIDTNNNLMNILQKCKFKTI